MAKMERTGTEGVFARGTRFVAVWREDGRQHKRAFPTYKDACAFRRDAVAFRERGGRGMPPSTLLSGPRDVSWLYGFARSIDGLVKVGRTSDAYERMTAHRLAQPGSGQVVWLMPVSSRRVVRAEAALKKALGPYQVEREWFAAEVLPVLAGLATEFVERLGTESAGAAPGGAIEDGGCGSGGGSSWEQSEAKMRGRLEAMEEELRKIRQKAERLLRAVMERDRDWALDLWFDKP
jgi:T5orf172 domain